MRLKKILKSTSLIYILLLTCVCIICSLFTYNKIFPITGGFYSVAAKSMGKGLLPYKDFQLLFPPVYTFFIYILTQIFGYNFIVIRIWGIIIFTLEAILLFMIFKQIFDEKSSFAGSIISVFMMQSGNAFTAYDYARIHDIFVFLAVLLFLKKVQSNASRKNFIFSFIIGVNIGLTIATRQSSGIVIAFTLFLLFVATILFFDDKKNMLIDLGGFILGIFLILFFIGIILYFTHTLKPFFQSITTDALAAKGGGLQALFGWLSEALIRMWDSKLSIILILLVGGIYFTLFYKIKDLDNKIKKFDFIILTCLLIGGMIFCYGCITFAYIFQAKYSSNIPYILFFILFVSFFSLLIYFIFQYVKYKKLDQFLMKFLIIESICIAMSWGGAMSASLGFLTGFPTIGLLSSLYLYLTKNVVKNYLYEFNLLINIIFCLIFFCNKIVSPYSWWGLNIESADQLIYSVDLPYMDGIKTSKSSKEFLEEVSKLILSNMKDEDKIFAFPHMPIFYLLTDKLPFTYSYLQWFDVSSDTALIQDMQKIKETAPKIIIMEYLPDYVFQGHEAAFRDGKTSRQRIMQTELTEFINTNNYTNVKTFDEENEYSIQVFVKDYEENSLEVIEPNDAVLNVKPDISVYEVELQEASTLIIDISPENLRNIKVDGVECSISSTNNGHSAIFLDAGVHEITITFQEWDTVLVFLLVITLMTFTLMTGAVILVRKKINK